MERLSCLRHINNKYSYLILGVVAIVVLCVYNPTNYWFWPKCPVKLLTGLSCPGCGIQRFVHAFMHGQFRTAVRYNYYLLYALPFLLLNVIAYYLPEGRVRESMKAVLESKPSLYFYIVSFVLWFIVRNIFEI